MRRASPSPSPARGSAVAAAAAVMLLPALFPAMFSPLGHAFPSLFSEWNAPKPMHPSLLNEALRWAIPAEQKRELWSPLPYQGWKQCLKSSVSHVAVAKILNATLVIPHLEVNPVWKDSSSFEEIFDVDHFINSLKDDVSIIKVLPKEFSWSTREYYGTGILLHQQPYPSAVTASYGIAAIAPFSHRLAFDDLPVDLQHLRCKVNFQALVFRPHIISLGEALVKRLRSPVQGHSDESIHQVVGEGTNQAGKYAVLHLRFDKSLFDSDVSEITALLAADDA
nr:unnamed protein product [Digitaria exilis]